ncbi:hypothetical protein VMCG_06243 [Cytospora schulzeri]|uniref:BTB domain-containing protein n=1 Tax=Cytospora schulzeri TaxID=448051 RepID=A0A423W975_9PEZI|nr:hypothetical protein VMCG_06243 [Valsa malicola]
MAATTVSNGEGSSRALRITPEGSSGTLRDVMRAPSTNTPDVVVLDSIPSGLNHKEVSLDPREDLWLSTADGRYSSAIIPLRVGTAPYQEVFQVHKSVLLKAEWFRKALLGEFLEAEAQSLDLPEEDPGIFHFLIAYLYEERYVPTKPLSTVLVPDPDKGKGRESGDDTAGSDSDSDALSWRSDSSSAQSRRRRDQRQRRDERHFERLRQKHPGVHRPHCNCPQCANSHGPPCWSCSAPRVAPPIAPPTPQPFVHGPDRSRRNNRRRGPDGRLIVPPPPAPTAASDHARIKGEDMRTWLMAYEHNLDVYICADKFLLDDFKQKISRVAIDMLETAGSDAAHVQVLRLCRKLYDGVRDNDPLLRMVFARVGFLQSTLWQRAPEETNEFLVENPEVAVLILKETVTRREDDYHGRTLPSMERPWTMPPGPRIGDLHRPFPARGVPHYDIRY